MIRKIWDIVSVVAVAHLLALAVLVAVLAGSGGLRGDRLAQARDALAGKPAPVVKVVEPAKESELAVLTTSGQLIAREQTHTAVTQLQIDQQMRELRDLQTQLDQARVAVERRVAQFERDKKDWQSQRQAEAALVAGEGFRKSVAFYESMSPEQVKDLMMTMDDAETVRILSAMEERKAAKVAKAFATDAEKARLRKIFERLEKPLAGAAPVTAAPAAAPPLASPTSGQGGQRGQPIGPDAEPGSRALPKTGTP